MKYSTSKPLVCLQTQSNCYKQTTKIKPLGVLWHSTGANNPELRRYVQPSDAKPAADTYNKAKWLEVLGTNRYNNDWNHIKGDVMVNAAIGKFANGTVAAVQTLPWDYRPWGVGSGSKGSCNDGWIQFEIAEDGLTDKTYFEKVYKEGCELTAYLCKLYNLDPKGTVNYKGVKIPVILCHCEAHDYGFGSGHADVMHWFKKHGKTMADVRNDVAALLAADKKTTTTTSGEIYRVRKTWKDAASQVGAYSSLTNAKAACDKAGSAYSVFNASGVAVYPAKATTTVSTKLKVGDAVKLATGAKYVSGESVPNWVIKSKLYLREILGNGNYVISILKKGAVTGTVAPKYVSAYTTKKQAAFKAYVVEINTSALNIRAGAGTKYKINGVVHKGEAYTIVEEKSGWGRLKSGAGWIQLSYTKKVN